MFRGFKEFISRGNVIDLAVGIVVGAAFTAVINAIVTGILTPLIALAFNAKSVEAWAIGPVAIGTVVSAVINFILVAAALYFFVVAPMNALAARRKAKAEAGEADEELAPTELEVLLQIKALLEKQAAEK